MLVPDLVDSGSAILLRSLVCSGLLMFVYGITRLGSSMLALDFFMPGLPLSSQSPGHSGGDLLVYGMTRLDLSLLAMDFIHLGLILPMRSFIYPDPLIFVYMA